MKRTAKLFGFIVIAAIIGFSFVSCKEEPENILAGTRWETNGGLKILQFTNSRASFYIKDVQGSEGGPYELSEDDTVVTFTSTSSASFTTATATATISGNEMTFTDTYAFQKVESGDVFKKVR